MRRAIPLKPIHQVIYAIILSVLLGWGLTQNPKMIVLFIAILAAFSAILLLPFYLRKYISLLHINNWKNIILYLFVFSSFLGPGLLSVRVGPISLFPYRVLLPVVGILFFYGWFFRNDRFSILHKKPVKPVLTYFILWVILGVVTIVWGKSTVDVIKEVFFLALGILMIFIFSTFFKKERDFKAILYVWMAGLLIIIALGFWNHFTKQALPTSRMFEAPMYIRDRPTGVFKNENDFASFLSISVFLLIPFIRYYKNWLVKLAGMMILLSSVYLIDATLSRANILALAIGVVFWLLFFTTKKEKQFLVIIGIGGMILGIALFSDTIIMMLNDIIIKVKDVLFQTGNETGSNSIRINLLKNALLFIAKTVGIGIAAGNIEYYIENYSLFPTLGTLNLHNWWMEILVQYGLLVFVGYIIIYLWMIISLLRLFFASSTATDRGLSAALCTSLVVFSLASVSPSSILTLNYSWVLWAFAIGYINYRKSKASNKNQEGVII
ncbi:O-antigen ligase family protein [Peribacillus alkalitolerans]|uniref:O-antigen ligase family protein n=1 Tax=Peribacillus alkalitolerans TaxID=1550385 RepID=UPI0013D373BA|nr:O-antigen ligase family protein [Peribacillus alkalitolerans]